MEITRQELQTFKGEKDYFNDCGHGYRIVYFYPDGHYYIGEFCKTIEGFMIAFCESYPIIYDNDIPDFISIDDLLSRYLSEMNEVQKVAIYATNGNCIAIKTRENIINR